MPYDPLLASTAIEAVLRAGDLQVAAFGGSFRVEKKGDIDLVTEVDLAVERMIRALIAARFPLHAILAEELDGRWDREAPAGYCWILDPIDGTTNYAHGLPIFSTSLGVQLDGQSIFGVVYDPMRKELFTADRGGGAYLNGAPMHVSRPSTLLDAVLVTGFPYDVHQKEASEELLGLFAAFIRKAQAVRRLGSAALDLCYVAAGRMEAFWERGLKPWDTAAGSLIVEEAAGRVTGMDGGPFDCRAGHVIASNGAVHESMLQVIRDFQASRSSIRTL